MTFNLLYENVLFFGAATSFFAGVGWAWRSVKPYHLPQPLPAWFRVWFLTIQIGGVVLPLAALVWSFWQSYFDIAAVLTAYVLMLGLQILSESVALRQFHSTVFVMVPYLYLPYRVWQLYEGLMRLNLTGEHLTGELIWLQRLLLFEIVLWTVNYMLDVAQLPRLLHWQIKADGDRG